MIPGRKIFTPAGIMRKIRKRDENLQYLGKPLLSFLVEWRKTRRKEEVELIRLSSEKRGVRPSSLKFNTSTVP